MHDVGMAFITMVGISLDGAASNMSSVNCTKLIMKTFLFGLYIKKNEVVLSTHGSVAISMASIAW